TSSASRHSQEPPGTRARLPIHAHAVDPYAVNADRAGREAGVAARKVVDAALRPPVHRGRIAKQEVRVETRLESAAGPDAEERRRMAREAPHRLLEGEYAEPPYPVPKQMQPEAGVVEEREVRAGIGERDEARRVAQHPADRFLVG